MTVLIIPYYQFVVMHKQLPLEPNIAYGKIKMRSVHISVSS